MVPPSTPLSGLVNGPLPEKYGKHFRKDATAMRAGPIGAITTSEAQQMRDLGILKGKWTIESEEEPSSDVQVNQLKLSDFLSGHEAYIPAVKGRGSQ